MHRSMLRIARSVNRVLDFPPISKRRRRVGFPGVDYLGIDEMLSDDERAVRDLVRGFVDEEVLPIIEECAYEGRFPRQLVPKIAAMNLFGATISDYGLPGLSNVAYGLIT